MTPPPDVEQVAVEALGLLEREAIDYMIMGGLAVNVWGVPRTTFDLDFEVDVSREDLPRLLRAADTAGFHFDEAYARGFAENVGGLPLVVIKRWSGQRAVHVDLFLAESSFLRAALARRVTTEVFGRLRPVASPADLLLFKLMAWRGKDRIDIQNILTIQGVPEEPHLRAWATRLGVTERLEAALLDFQRDQSP